MPPFKHRRCAFNQKHPPCSRLVLRSLGEGGREKTSSVFICSADYAVTSKSNVSETSSSTFAQGYGGQASKSSLEFGEDVPALLHYAVARKKRLRLLSEELLLAQKREVKPSVFALLATPWQVRLRSPFSFLFKIKMADPPSLKLRRDKERGIRCKGAARSKPEQRSRKWRAAQGNP